MTLEEQEMANQLRRLTLIFVAFVLPANVAHAFTFMPTDIEWQSWPSYCKARYATSSIGKKSKFALLVSPAQTAELAQWDAEGIAGLHHYCAGTIWLARAKAERDPQQKRYKLNRAMGETMYSYKRSNALSPKFTLMATQLAAVYYEQGEYDPALQVLFSAIADNPDNDVLYSAAALMQRKLGNKREAINTLLRGYEAVDGKSAEVCYNLGLISLELGDVDDAEKYAKLAYEQGFPLPGLRNKLKKLGRM